MPRHSLASQKIVHQKNLRSRRGRSLPGMPFGSFMVTAPCRRTASARLWAQLSSNPYRDQSRFQQSIDMPPASKSKGKLSIDCFFLCLNSTANISATRPSNQRVDGRRWGSDSLWLTCCGLGGRGVKPKRSAGLPAYRRELRHWCGTSARDVSVSLHAVHIDVMRLRGCADYVEASNGAHEFWLAISRKSAIGTSCHEPASRLVGIELSRRCGVVSAVRAMPYAWGTSRQSKSNESHGCDLRHLRVPFVRTNCIFLRVLKMSKSGTP
jgi:hypothetical protein